ncbi:MAG TPA: hypothetical protein VF399_00750 [bacterium]
MVQYLLLLSMISQGAIDSVPMAPAPASARKSYTAQILVNGIIGLGFGTGAAVFYMKSGSSYDAYLKSDSLCEATDYYNNTVFYDNLRNICAGGAVLFLAQALYYQLKSVRTKTASRPAPEIDLGMSEKNKYFICLRQPI